MFVSTWDTVLGSDSLSWKLMLTFEYVVVGIPPPMADKPPLALLGQRLLHGQRLDSDQNGQWFVYYYAMTCSCIQIGPFIRWKGSRALIHMESRSAPWRKEYNSPVMAGEFRL